MSMYRLGKTYKELSVGDFAMQSKTISESDVYNFSGITGDFNPDDLIQLATSSSASNKIAVPPGIAPALIAPVIGMKLPGIGSMVIDMQFELLLPAFIGDTIFACAKVIEKKPQSRQVVMRLDWYNQDNQKITTGTATVMPPKAALKRHLEKK